MRTLKRVMMAMLAFVMMATFALGGVKAKANPAPGETTDTVYFGDGFFCLHPHKERPSAFHPIEMEAVPSTEYAGYPQETLDQFAALIMLQMDYYYATGGEDGGVVINNTDLQAIIWNIVCEKPEDKNYQRHLSWGSTNDAEYIALKAKRLAYYEYVLDHLDEVRDEYTMTIWVSSNPEYQDILELRLLEKHGIPTMEKKVLDRNDTDNTYDAAIGWQDAADYDIGDVVPFQLTATLSNMPKFNKYYLEFVDTMQHLTFVEDSLTVTLDGEDVTDSFTFEKEREEDSPVTNMRIYCENILPLGAVEGSQFVVNYSATLDEDAVIGNPGNPNTAKLIYTRSSGIADRGETAPDTVKVFTYRLTANKVDPDENPMTGAAFKLSKLMESGEYVTVAVIGATETIVDGKPVYTLTDDDRTEFVWTGIDDGTYKLEEVVTPVGYNTMETVVFWVKGAHDHKAEDPKLHYVNSNYAGFDNFMSAEWLPTVGIEDNDVTGFVGLETGEMIATIVNQPGSILPETGGAGTKLFYLVGSMMALGAGVVLITRKRMGA